MIKVLCLFLFAALAAAQTAYGVSSTNQLFSFDLIDPSVTSNIGTPLAFLPEGIDFRPGTNQLYAIDIDVNTTRLYTIDITTGVATAVGNGFNTTTANYTLTPNDGTIGFNFNPTTLQVDNSMRIRLIDAATGTNLRLHSATGAVAAIDGRINFNGTNPFLGIRGAAYSNNVPSNGTIGGNPITTTLYDISTMNDNYYTQIPPNNGTLNLVGPIGVDVTSVAFDIWTDNTTTPFTNFGYAAALVGGSYSIYSVNVATGAFTNALSTTANFAGGFAINPLSVPTIPSPPPTPTSTAEPTDEPTAEPTAVPTTAAATTGAATTGAATTTTGAATTTTGAATTTTGAATTTTGAATTTAKATTSAASSAFVGAAILLLSIVFTML